MNDINLLETTMVCYIKSHELDSVFCPWSIIYNLAKCNFIMSNNGCVLQHIQCINWHLIPTGFTLIQITLHLWPFHCWNLVTNRDPILYYNMQLLICGIYFSLPGVWNHQMKWVHKLSLTTKFLWYLSQEQIRSNLQCCTSGTNMQWFMCHQTWPIC